MGLKIVWVNPVQREYEQKMQSWLDWLIREERCIDCESPGAVYFASDGVGMCEPCMDRLSAMIDEMDDDDPPPEAA